MATFFGIDDGVTGYGVRGDSADAEGVRGNSTKGSGLEGHSRDGSGVAGFSNGPSGVHGESLIRGNGVEGISPEGNGVYGESFDGYGVAGKSGAVGVQGESTSYNFGVLGIGPNAGVAAFNPNNQNAAYLASDCCAAWFTGEVVVTGPIFKSGGGFRIDHPLEPAEKFLSHSFVESSEMKNIYDGTAQLDESGGAVIELPHWFEKLNADFRYQLTALGEPAPNLHVVHELEKNRFTVGGGRPKMKVSWQVTGIRHDPWATKHRVRVESLKAPSERGFYLHPELHNVAKEKHLGRNRHAPRKPEKPGKN